MKEMWSLGLPYQLTLIAVFVGALPANFYPFILAFIKWNKTDVGRSMMFKGLALMLVFDVGIMSLWWANEDWFPWLTLAVDAWLTFAVWYQVTTVINVIREGETDRRLGTSPRKRVA